MGNVFSSQGAIGKVPSKSIRPTKGFSCPLCGCSITWSCSGKRGYAYCSRSLKATWDSKDKKLPKKICEWKGTVTRKKDGKTVIEYSSK